MMRKATERNCDFDKPESPIERIIRGLTIALDGANAENDFFEDIRRSIKEDLDFTRYELKNRKLRTMYAAELAKATADKALVFFEFNKNGVATEIKIDGMYTNHVSAISAGEKSRHDVKRAVEEWVEKEAQKCGQKAKVAG